jgi:hypothetical protein
MHRSCSGSADLNGPALPAPAAKKMDGSFIKLCPVAKQLEIARAAEWDFLFYHSFG